MHGEHAAEVQAAGGKGRSNASRAIKLMPARLAPLVVALERIFAELDRGERDPKIASTMATVALVISRLVMAGELEERLRQLETQAREAQEEREQEALGVGYQPQITPTRSDRYQARPLQPVQSSEAAHRSELAANRTQRQTAKEAFAQRVNTPPTGEWR